VTLNRAARIRASTREFTGIGSYQNESLQTSSSPTHSIRKTFQMWHYIQIAASKSIAFGVLAGVAACQLTATEPEHSPPEMLADAELADVFFLDADQGWAAGDRGVILWTEDGGRRWELADSPVNCRLEAIFFLDADRGWAVGGWTHPYTHKSTGVVLQTANGGRRWTRLAATTLPKLKQVYFQDARHGWAVGNASAMYPAGVFLTRDAGETWSSVATGEWLGCVDADNTGSGPIAISTTRTAVLTGKNELLSRPLPGLDRRQMRAIHRRGSQQTWIVGDGGLVQASNDGGATWTVPPALPQVAVNCQFRDVATVGPGIWVVGEPGSCVLHSPDGGLSWQWQTTGLPLPIEAVHFVDANHGWMVGSLGTIAATRDGGETWIRQRGGDRVATLGLFSTAQNVPLELFARLAGDEGYLAAVEVLTTSPAAEEAVSETSAAERIHESVVGVGASSGRVGNLLLPHPGLQLSAESIVGRWDRTLGGDSLTELEAEIVQRIRQWRPEIVVTQHPDHSSKNAVDYLVNQVVLAAVERAADETSFPEHLQELGLEVWQAKKVFAMMPNGSPGSLSLDTSRLATRLGRTLADYSSVSRGIKDPVWSPAPRKIEFDLLTSIMPREVAVREFFQGILLPAGEAPRRPLSAPPATDLKTLTRVAQKERNVQQILRRAAKKHNNATSWLGQIDDLLRDLSPSAAGDVLFQLAHSYVEEGQFDLASEAFMLLIHRDPDHALSEMVLLRLLELQTSAEARWGLLRDGDRIRRLAWQQPTTPTPPARPGSVVQASAVVSNTMTPADLVQQRPTLRAEPAVRFSLASLHRQAGRSKQALQVYRRLAGNSVLRAWSQCGRGEVWLASHIGLSPKLSAVCAKTNVKPHLDGILNEALWAEREILRLTSPNGEDDQLKASVQLAYDDKYLYWGVACRKDTAANYPTAEGHRTHDSDLTGHDRVDLMIDIDRDYSTYFRLTVDHRGWTGDTCLQQTRWNPTWHVASNSDETTWTVEVAIPLDELVAQMPNGGDVWAIGIQRTVPGVGCQSWSQPADREVRPEGFGYLRFRGL
jgi:photosystem II stability/assembly factor-like uncharacterized protein/tetratricopeptide (TPR) repeat protein